MAVLNVREQRAKTLAELPPITACTEGLGKRQPKQRDPAQRRGSASGPVPPCDAPEAACKRRWIVALRSLYPQRQRSGAGL